jgi:hypothetical protein
MGATFRTGTGSAVFRVGPGASQGGTTPPEPPNYNQAYLFMGQSNIAGTADYGGSPSSSRIVFYNNPRNAVVVPFADAMIAKDPNIHVMTILTATGSWIKDWYPGYPRTLYDDTVVAATIAISQGYYIAGVIWQQGESDALDDANRTDDWSTAFEEVMTYLRLDLGDIPVAYAKIAHTADPGSYPYWSHVQDEIDQVSLTNSTEVQTDPGITLRDSVHFSDASWTTMGQRFADTLWTLQGN